MRLKSRVVTSLKREEAICEVAIQRLRVSITEYEAKYGLSTDEFLKKFDSGELGDDADFFEWYALAEAVKDWRETRVS